jgi:AcrR family transcriptional regulator
MQRKTASSRSTPVAADRPGNIAKRARGRPAVYSREEILRAAKLAFSQSGYANVSLDQLAARLNTGKGTIYYHSNRKVDLLIAISRTFIRGSTRDLQKIRDLDLPADVRFAKAMRVLMGDILSDQQGSKIYFENEGDLPKPIRAELRGARREMEQVFIQIVADGCRAGLFNCDPVMAVRHAMGVAVWPYRWYAQNGALTKDEFIDTAINFVLSAFKAGERQEATTALSARDRKKS